MTTGERITYRGQTGTIGGFDTFPALGRMAYVAFDQSPRVPPFCAFWVPVADLTPAR